MSARTNAFEIASSIAGRNESNGSYVELDTRNWSGCFSMSVVRRGMN